MEDTWYEQVMKEHTSYWKNQEKSGFNPDNLPGINRGKINVIMAPPGRLGKSNFNPCLEIYMGTGGDCVLGQDWESLFYEPNKLLLIC